MISHGNWCCHSTDDDVATDVFLSLCYLIEIIFREAFQLLPQNFCCHNICVVYLPCHAQFLTRATAWQTNLNAIPIRFLAGRQGKTITILRIRTVARAYHVYAHTHAHTHTLPDIFWHTHALSHTQSLTVEIECQNEKKRETDLHF